MNPQDILKLYKSQAAMARAFEVTPPSVIKWLRTGFPPLRVYQAKVLLGKAYKAATEPF